MDAGAAAGAAADAAGGAGTWAKVMTRLPASATPQLSHCAYGGTLVPYMPAQWRVADLDMYSMVARRGRYASK